MTNDILRIIKIRRSVRTFLPDQIDNEELAAIIDAGYASNGGGEAAWHIK